MTPRELKFKMPPEWAAHQRTFMEWPVIEALWPGPFEEVLTSYGEIVKAIASFEPVTLIVKPELVSQAKEYCGKDIEYLELEHNDSWIRDNGPTFLLDPSGQLAGVNWIFNAWGGKYPCKEDNLVASAVLNQLGIRRFDADFVMEGGSIHVDGEGTLLTTEECLLNKNRNSHLNKNEITELLKNYLGIEKIVWLKKGLHGDDTDGHIDNVACFAAPGVIITQVCNDPEDPDYELSKENLETLRKERDAEGREFKIIEIEKPERTFYEDQLLTLSYLNFYFVNGGIILPVFGGRNSQRDQNAAEILKGVFPERRVVPVDGLVVARGGGNVHCLTQQMPAGK